ncbi:ubiquitin-specific protease otu1 [Dissophora ornata]|nr:ubiquitin-specific protease otu1 [Dissophora ornata]
MRLRIRHREGIATVTSLTAQSSLLDLHNEVAKETNIPVATLELKFGYPPKLLVIDHATAQSSLESLGIKDGEQILTSERPEGTTPAYSFVSNNSSSSAVSPSTSEATTTNTATPAHNINSINSSPFAASAGSGGGAFGSRPVIPTAGAQSAFQARHTTVSTFGGPSTTETAFKPVSVPAVQPTMVSGGAIEAVRVRDQGFLVVREVADDNSCLFNAIAYTIDHAMKNNVRGLRQIVADTIAANCDAYPDVVLGRPRKEYCDWIRRENSWGGAIELAIFSEHYKIEIDSIDVSTNRVDRFDYDALALTPGLDIPADCDQTQFDCNSEDITTAGLQLADKLKKV